MLSYVNSKQRRCYVNGVTVSVLRGYEFLKIRFIEFRVFPAVRDSRCRANDV